MAARRPTRRAPFLQAVGAYFHICSRRLEICEPAHGGPDFWGIKGCLRLCETLVLRGGGAGSAGLARIRNKQTKKWWQMVALGTNNTG